MMLVKITVTFIALSNYRDDLVVNKKHRIEPDGRSTFEMPCKTPLSVQYGQWSRTLEPWLSGYLDVIETRGHQRFRLVFAPEVNVLMTHSLRKNVDYLPQTLRAWGRMPKPFSLTVFSTERENAQKNNVRFVRKPKNDRSVQAHKKDVINMIDDLPKNESALFMFAEDDFPPCETMRSMEILQDLPQNFSGIVLAVGMTGLTFQTRDAPAIKKYVQNNLKRQNKQIDHLLQEWLLKEKPEARHYLGQRKPIASRVMQFDHIGVVSAVGHYHPPQNFNCGDSMRSANFPGLNFDARAAGMRSWAV